MVKEKCQWLIANRFLPDDDELEQLFISFDSIYGDELKGNHIQRHQFGMLRPRITFS
jgi:hypothetical protein